MKEKPLSAEEAALWARVVASVAPMAGRTAKSSPPSGSSMVEGTAMVERGRAQQHPVARVPDAKQRVQTASNTLDGGWDRRLARGVVQPDLSVDLHGHTLDTAYRTLDAGLGQAILTQARVLLLVTGKPRAPGTGRGSIRAAVGDWLAASRHSADIAAVRGAHPRHGGAGALYIILKRRRDRLAERR